MAHLIHIGKRIFAHVEFSAFCFGALPYLYRLSADIRIGLVLLGRQVPEECYPFQVIEFLEEIVAEEFLFDDSIIPAYNSRVFQIQSIGRSVHWGRGRISQSRVPVQVDPNRSVV